ncbi:DUF3006 domain-containing protein [Halobacterium yunchengense]|uniref:DUF3006 domain-containing protein n=1 Tax=Halobacterium yunchengense TaxID=3108497 RepID=UPI00300951A8
MNDGTYTAVVDRFEEDLAVLLLEADGETVAERVLERERLPDAGRHVDAVLTVEVEDGEVVDLAYEPSATTDRADAAQSRFDRLSRRPPSAEAGSTDEESGGSGSEEEESDDDETDDDGTDDDGTDGTASGGDGTDAP